MKRIVMAFLAAFVLLGVGCRPDEDPGFTPTTPRQYSDTYSGAGDQVFHVAAAGGEGFDYTLDLGTAVKDVYFVFTNTSASARSIPTVSASVIPKGGVGGSPVRSPVLPHSGVASAGLPRSPASTTTRPWRRFRLRRACPPFPRPQRPATIRSGARTASCSSRPAWT